MTTGRRDAFYHNLSHRYDIHGREWEYMQEETLGERGITVCKSHDIKTWMLKLCSRLYVHVVLVSLYSVGSGCRGGSFVTVGNDGRSGSHGATSTDATSEQIIRSVWELLQPRSVAVFPHYLQILSKTLLENGR